jgi:hypothetical protein
MPRTLWPTMLLVLLGLVPGRAVRAADKPTAGSPKYHVAQGTRASGSQKMTLYLQIRVAPGAISKDRLLQLVCTLRTDFAREQRLKVWIFTDSEAAKRFNFDQSSSTYREDLAKLRGAYWLDREKSEQWIRFSSALRNPRICNRPICPRRCRSDFLRARSWRCA